MHARDQSQVSKPQSVTLKDIAARAGVSKMTVSAALTGNSTHVFVSEATRQRTDDVIAKAEEARAAFAEAGDMKEGGEEA